MGEAGKSKLVKSTLGEMVDAGVLPSGCQFDLMPDTVEVALRVAEASDPYKWKEKLLQVLAVTSSVNGENIREKGGVDFLGGLLDTDVVFLALAWTHVMNDRRIKLNEAIPCPQCASPFAEIPLDVIGVSRRESKPSGPFPMFEVDGLNDDMLPTSLKGNTILVGEPTWIAARKNIPENSWDKPDAIRIYRSLCALYAQNKEGKAPRQVSRTEAVKIKMRGVHAIAQCLDDNVPSIDSSMVITCSECGSESEVPFEQVAG